MTTTMNPAPTVDTIEAKIQGDISGQVAVGSYILQIGSIHGGLITMIPPEKQSLPHPRTSPISLRPHRFPGLLDRADEISAVTTALESAIPAEFYGEPGVGKTCLLRSIAYRPASNAFSDGVICLPVRQQTLDDVLQSLFDAFFEHDSDYKPTDGQIRQALNDKQALVLLDDAEFDRDDVDSLIDVLPGCTCVFTSMQRSLWGQGQAIALHGLPTTDALLLIERELGRHLNPEERPAADHLCQTLHGHPLRLLQSAAWAREENLTLNEVTRRIGTASPSDALANAIVGNLTEPERHVLATLAALGTASIHPDHLAAITQVTDIQSALNSLSRRNLALTASPSIVAASTINEATRSWDLTTWRVRTLTYFTQWVEQNAKIPERVLEASEPALYLLQWAVETARWPDVLRLGQAAEGALALGRRWGAWEMVLGWIQHAARQLGNQAALALALHQSGTRALCLGNTVAGKADLTRALEIREALGDELGAALTRHNLNLLSVPAAAPKTEPRPRPTASGSAISLPIVLSSIAVVATVLLLGMGAWYMLSAVVAPSDLSAAAMPGGQIVLTWTDNSNNEDGFIVERRAGDTGFSEIAQVSSDVRSYTDTDVEHGITYTYRVRSFHEWAPAVGPRKSAPSNSASATVGGISVLTNLTVHPERVQAGDVSTAIVSLNASAPQGGATVRLSSSDPAVASVPEEITIEAGQTSSEFPVSTHDVTEPAEATIRASLGDSEVQAKIQVEPPQVAPTLKDIVLDPSQVTGGETVNGTVDLNDPAPEGGVTVVLHSEVSDVAMAEPDSVTINSGETEATFEVQTFSVAEPTEVVLSASLGDGAETATLIVVPPTLSSLECQPDTITGGDTVTCTVTLNGAAPAGGSLVNLRSVSDVASPDSRNIRIPGGDRRVSFSVQTTQVETATETDIVASIGEDEKSFKLSVLPPPLADLIVSSFERTGEPTIASDGRVLVPIRVVVKNVGNVEAGIFKVSLEISAGDGTHMAGFTVQGQSDSAYPYTKSPLSASDEVSFDGTASIYPAYQGQTVSLWAVADSCSGDEFMPDYCRVQESDGENNRSEHLEFDLPLAAPSGLTATNTGDGVLLRWVGSGESMDECEIWRSIDGTEFGLLTTVPATDSSYTDNDLQSGELSEGSHVFSYRLRVVIQAGVESAFSSTARVVISFIY